MVGEAMACGTPCVVTDVGDARDIVGDSGWIVPPDNTTALANGILQAIESKLDNRLLERIEQCRLRIVEQYSHGAMLDNFNDQWKDIPKSR